jgi:adenylate kinase
VDNVTREYFEKTEMEYVRLGKKTETGHPYYIPVLMDFLRLCKEFDTLIEDEKLSEGYDKKLKSKIVDVKKLNKKLVEIIKKEKNLVIDSHLSHYLDKKYVDLCVVVKCGLEKLKKRLEKRKYSKKKIRDNLDSEIFDVCFVEALERGQMG